VRGLWCALIGCALLLVAAQPAAGQLVALGDSYSSGEGAPPFQPRTAPPFGKCHRSTRAWPLLVAGRLGFRGISYACSGDETKDLLANQVGLLEGVRRASIVTLTIGGNDAGFKDVLIRCGAKSSCIPSLTGDNADNLDRAIDNVGRSLPAVYERVQDAMPAGARLVVVGYPRLFPTAPDTRTCAFFGWISQPEARRLNEYGARMNDRIEQAAARADVAFIDVEDDFARHEVSCRGEQWINRVQVSDTISYSFHPNLFGQRALAERVATALGVPATPLLRADGIGKAGLGGSRRDVRRVLGTARPCAGDPLLEFDERGRFAAYASSAPTALTEKMLAVGDPADFVELAYNGSRLSAVPAGGRNVRYVRSVVSDRNRLVFEAKNGLITRFVAGARDRTDPTAIC
jgi:lysophospholipase L1-like esterase